MAGRVYSTLMKPVDRTKKKKSSFTVKTLYISDRDYLLPISDLM